MLVRVSEVFRYAVDMRLAAFWVPFGLRPSGHSALTVTVAEVEGLVTALPS
jgi:hypothetical protein